MRRNFLGMIFQSLRLSASVEAGRNQRAAMENSDVEVTRSAALGIPITGDPSKAFDDLADARKLEPWFPDQAVLEPELGGRYHFRRRDQEGVWSGRITHFMPSKTLSFTWLPPSEEYETNVQFKPASQGQRTLVELTHTGFTSNAAMDKAVQGWVFHLENLTSVIEKGLDLRQAMQPKASGRPPHRHR